MKTNIQTLKGFRDFLPAEKRKRNYVLEKVVEIFERFGFEPLETPTLEYAALLLGKYGSEADKLVYAFEDNGKRKVGLRYDQTVPTARVLAQYQNRLPKYFRRYQIQNVFRADKPQKGRFREFTQCDIDIFGSTSALADAEILSCTYAAYKNVGYPVVSLKINDRQTLFKTLQPFATDNVTVFSIIQSVDKLDKQTSEQVINELRKKGLSKQAAENILKSIETAEMSENLRVIISTAQELGIPSTQIVFAPSLARGLDYYTGIIFEVMIEGYMAGSCGGGGRYDKLIEQLGGNDTPAVGIAFGFDRMVEAANELELFPDKVTQAGRVFVTIFSKETIKQSLSLVLKLRSKNIATELWVGEIKEKNTLEKQLKYADEREIPYVVILGPEEIKNNTIILKNLKEKRQTTINSLDDLTLALS